VRQERRRPTRREWELITSRRPVVRRVIRREASGEGLRGHNARRVGREGVEPASDRGRHDQRVRTDGERVEEELWIASERRYLEIKRRQSVAAWFAYFCLMRDNHARLSEDYQRRAEALCEEDSGGG
jgi:hypothetical protein